MLANRRLWGGAVLYRTSDAPFHALRWAISVACANLGTSPANTPGIIVNVGGLTGYVEDGNRYLVQEIEDIVKAGAR